MKKAASLILCIVLIFTMALPAFAAVETPYNDSEFFEYKGYTIHYREWEAKNPKGQIIMLHGFAHTTYCWHDIAGKLVDEGYTCVLVDLPDFGYSSRDTMKMEKLPREEIIHALMTYLSDEKWYVAGHSMGGVIAQAIYAAYPESVENLLLYGTSGNPTPSELAKFMGNPFVVKVVSSFIKIFSKFDGLFNGIISFALRYCMLDNKYFETYDYSEIVKSLKREGTAEGIFYSFSMLKDTDYEAVRNGNPVLYINGDRDGVISKDSIAYLTSCLPEGSVCHTIEGAGHLLIENYADEVAELTLDFLKK